MRHISLFFMHVLAGSTMLWVILLAGATASAVAHPQQADVVGVLQIPGLRPVAGQKVPL